MDFLNKTPHNSSKFITSSRQEAILEELIDCVCFILNYILILLIFDRFIIIIAYIINIWLLALVKIENENER